MTNLCIENGEYLLVLDDESRENEGDLIVAAEHITTEKMAFIVRWSRYVTFSHFLIFIYEVNVNGAHF